MSYLDQILDQLNEDADLCVYELYLQNNISTLCNMSLDYFEDVYYALFDDELDELEENKNSISLNSYDEFHECIDILYSQMIYECSENYSYVRFLAEIDKKEWDNIIHENLNIQNISKDDKVFEFYRKLRNNKINTKIY